MTLAHVTENVLRERWDCIGDTRINWPSGDSNTDNKDMERRRRRKRINKNIGAKFVFPLLTAQVKRITISRKRKREDNQCRFSLGRSSEYMCERSWRDRRVYWPHFYNETTSEASRRVRERKIEKEHSARVLWRERQTETEKKNRLDATIPINKAFEKGLWLTGLTFE